MIYFKKINDLVWKNQWFFITKMKKVFRIEKIWYSIDYVLETFCAADNAGSARSQLSDGGSTIAGSIVIVVHVIIVHAVLGVVHGIVVGLVLRIVVFFFNGDRTAPWRCRLRWVRSAGRNYRRFAHTTYNGLAHHAARLRELQTALRSSISQ